MGSSRRAQGAQLGAWWGGVGGVGGGREDLEGGNI